MQERTAPSSLSTPILYLKLPNPLGFRCLVLLFLLFPILVQVPVILVLVLFLLIEPLGVERELWGKIKTAD